MSVRNFCITFIVVLVFFSCEKEENKAEEKPFIALLNQPAVLVDTGVTTMQWIYGFRFYANKDGKIKGLGMKLPLKGVYKVSLWNLETGQRLKEETLTATADHSEVYNTISEVSLEKNKEFGVSIEANSFYKIRKADNSEFTFPIQEGNIAILSFHASRVSENQLDKFPSMPESDELSPCVDVIFIED